MKTATAARVGVKVRSEGEENLIFFAIANLFFLCCWWRGLLTGKTLKPDPAGGRVSKKRDTKTNKTITIHLNLIKHHFLPQGNMNTISVAAPFPFRYFLFRVSLNSFGGCFA